MRIISGELKGRRLLAPRGDRTRPTSDRVKEALFSILGRPERRGEQRFRVLDLYCGSGALALEALSRGADEAVLVDEDREAVEVARKNLEALEVSSRARLVRREVGATLVDLDGAFDWVFLDPPYQGGQLDRALRLLGSRDLVAGVACAEHDANNPPADSYHSLALSDRRRWGDTAVSFYRPLPAAEGPGPEAGA